MKKSIWGIANLLFGVVPLFFAFLFGAYCMFHENEKFDTLTKAAATLNAILAGDEVLNFINPLMNNYGNIGLIFSMGFCIMFIVCIHNVFIFVIGEAFKDETEIHEKQKRREKKVGKALGKDQKVSFVMNINSTDMNQLSSKLEETVASSSNMEKKEIVRTDEQINFAKKKIYNKIIPQSRDRHIIEMNHKKSMVKDDIHFLKESIQNLVAEKLGSINN